MLRLRPQFQDEDTELYENNNAGIGGLVNLTPYEGTLEKSVLTLKDRKGPKKLASFCHFFHSSIVSGI